MADRQYICDFHIHSRYSRACSKSLSIPSIANACIARGIDICVTGDFTHPAWFLHMRETLVESSPGIFVLKDGASKTKFILGTEVSVIKKDKGKTRRVHHLVFAPNIAAVEAFCKILKNRGCNLTSDGRPILGLTSKELFAITKESDARMEIIPAHAWTPWFGIFGAQSGYDSLYEAFDEYAPSIFAIETGLSSDPIMNRQCPWLDDVALISSSDAHSIQKLGREATIVYLSEAEVLNYDAIISALRQKRVSTIEFFPEEGKYHIDGHAVCKFSCEPQETRKLFGKCPVCGRSIVKGVLYRVEELGTRSNLEAKEKAGVFYRCVPLPEIIADVLGVSVNSKKVILIYEQMINSIGSEFFILLFADAAVISKKSSPDIASAILRVRSGNVRVQSGYDGVFGRVSVQEKSDFVQRRLL